MATTLSAFNSEQKQTVRVLLATQVALMMGRKFEEDDWAKVYCRAKAIPERGWSNLNIDVMHNGLGVEHKMYCGRNFNNTIRELAGTTIMHPSATRSIRIESTAVPANDAMRAVLEQYRQLIEQRTNRVKENSGKCEADMRTGWLIWERTLTEFLYFEERMTAPNPDMFYAEWNEREAQGARKGSKNLWIYETSTGKKRYSITTSAGAKIQPYFDVPPPSDENLYYFKVQGEEVKTGLIVMWITASTARELKGILGSLDSALVSDAIIQAAVTFTESQRDTIASSHVAIPIEITKIAYEKLVNTWGGVSDEHRAQLLVRTLMNK